MTDHARDFDFLVGRWTVRHRKLRARLAGCSEWDEFDGTSQLWTTLGGHGTIDDNVLNAPAGTYRAVTVRSYDPAAQFWSIWWLDSRMPQGPLDPALRGRFEDVVGTFLGDDTFEGRPIKVRFIWTRLGADAARWEQAFTEDGGETWETNWTMQFAREISVSR